MGVGGSLLACDSGKVLLDLRLFSLSWMPAVREAMYHSKDWSGE